LPEIVKDYEQAIKTLNWIISIIKYRKIGKCNMPKIVIIFDELSHLMHSYSQNEEFEKLLIEIATHGKEVGIYMIFGSNLLIF
jgi:DNA segregation ATPase FtsK/SpoIIIE-like protein